MSIRLYTSLILLLFVLNGCGFSKTRTVTELDTLVCPPKKPDLICKDLPDRGETLREMLKAWQETILIHKECQETVNLWDTLWEDC